MKKTTIKFQLPLIICADDYHDAKELALTLSGITNEKIKSKELPGFFDGCYYFVFYIHKTPSKEELNSLMKEEAFCV